MRTPVYVIRQSRSRLTYVRLGATMLVETAYFPAMGIRQTTTFACDATESTTDAIRHIAYGDAVRVA